MGRRANGQFGADAGAWIPEARARIARGETARAVAARFGISEALVSKRCTGARKAWLRRRDELIRTLVRGGFTRAQAAQVARCSFGTAQRAAAGLGAVTRAARLRQARRLVDGIPTIRTHEETREERVRRTIAEIHAELLKWG